MRKLLTLSVSIMLFCGCAMFTRTVYVPDGKAIRLRQKVTNVKIWVKEVGGGTAEGRLDLPEGWYCLPMKEGK